MKNSVHLGTNAASTPAVYLILQGLGSPFFKMLASHLAAEGTPVHKVNFCGGDWWFAGRTINHRFNGTPNQLAAFYRRLIEEHQVTTILLFGDCRPIHKTARNVAADMGLRVWAFEEGYIRPGYITCEQAGTNDLSTLPRMPDQLQKRAAQIDAQVAEVKASSENARSEEAAHTETAATQMPARVRMDITHHLWNILLKPLYFRYRSHRPDSVTSEIKGWASRLKRKVRFKNINSALVQRYQELDNDFFMVPLQLNSDFQIREHSNYESVLEFIREIVASFARNAPKNTLLMLKSHPLDNGMIDYRNYIAMAAIKHGIEGRVDYLEGGDLNIFLSRTKGVVLINSTVGYAALAAAKPIKVMGRALYNMTGLAEQRPLDKFWKNPAVPNQQLIDDFLKVIRTDSQIAGNLFTGAGLKMAAQTAADRIKRTQPTAMVPDQLNKADAIVSDTLVPEGVATKAFAKEPGA